MFGAVVLGNQITQELHPKGSSHLNSVTLVDSEDRAIATTAVESYVSLLDLPLLGTAELNKVDGITFRTHRGIEHRKVTGYTVTTETARVGDSAAKTPRLSLTTSAPGATVEVSVRDNKAWLSEVEGSSSTITPIDTSSQRHLADGGSCLESGACLYSRDELLRLDAASRRLEEGSFFARADVAAYQVELSGDLMQYMHMEDMMAAREATLDGTYSEGGHSLRLRLQEGSEGVQALFTNLTSGESKLVTTEGNFVFSATGRLIRCNSKQGFKATEGLTVDNVADAIAFEAVAVTHDAPAEGFIPFEPSVRECFHLTTQQANLSTPEALERFPEVAGALQRSSKSDIQAMKDRLYKVESRRKLSVAAADGAATAVARSEAQELVSLMTNPNSGRHLTAEELSHPDRKRVLQAARAKAHTPRELAVTITKFDLWVATRMADPISITSDYDGGISPGGTKFETVATNGLGDAELSLDLSGWHGVRAIFAEWSGFHLFNQVAVTGAANGMSAGAQASTLLLQQQYSGTCVGAFNAESEALAEEVVVAACDGFSYEDIQMPPMEEAAKFESHHSHCSFFFGSYKTCKESKDPKSTWGFDESFRTCGEPIIEGCHMLASSDGSSDSAMLKSSNSADLRSIDSVSFTAYKMPMFRKLALQMDSDFACPPHIAQILAMDTDAIPRDVLEKYPGCAGSCPADVTKKIDYYSGILLKSKGEDMEAVMGLQQIMKEFPQCALKAQATSGTCPTHMIDECTQALIHYVELTTPITVLVEDTCDGRRRSLWGEEEEEFDPAAAAAAVVLPTGYAAILYKTKVGGASPWDAKYVVSFQGTKFSEPAMLMYTLQKEAVYVDLDGVDIVTTEGFAKYVAETGPCIADLIETYNIPIQYITGHSLGGAAATLFKQAGKPGTLVTFGAPPTTPLAYDKVAVAYEMIYPSKAVMGGRAFPDKSGIPATYSDPSVGGIRYFHKFDPVPGYYMGFMQWKHAPATAYLLYDADAPCATAGGPSLGSGYVLADYGGTGSVASSLLSD